MDHSLTFARHFAHLVWLLLNEADDADAQLDTLRSLVSDSRHGGVVIAARDWRLFADGQPVPDGVTGGQDLVAQLTGHAIAELTVEPHATVSDLLLTARVLATEPAPGDGGRAALARLQALDARTVHARVDLPAAAQRSAPATPVSAGAGSGFVRDSLTMFMPASDRPTAARHDGAPEGQANGPGRVEHDILREQDPEQMFEVFAATGTPKGSAVKLFEALDAATNSAAAVVQLDALVKLATESARKGHVDLVADVFHGIVKREEDVADKSIKRQYGMAVRRLSTPGVLKCVVELLPRRREHYEQYMAIFVRAEEAGVEALVDALVSAPSITDRRVYFDSLLRMRTGVRTLIHMLGDPRWYVVRNAIELLGEMRVTDAEHELTRLLEHRDDRVRTAAASALAKLGATAAAKGMRGALKSAPAQVRERAAEAVALQSKGAVDSLSKAFDREEDSRVQMAMLTALGRLGTPQAVEKLAEIARTEKGLFRKMPTQLRVAAVHALGEVKSASAIAELQALLRDKDKAVRGAASWVLMGQRRETGQSVSSPELPEGENES